MSYLAARAIAVTAVLREPRNGRFAASFVWVFVMSACVGPAISQEANPIVRQRPINIAHRGASGYLPEHTLAAKALAVGMGADYIEQDIVLTGDDHPIVLHDIHLDTVTDVSTRFPDRARSDGRYYAIDFTLGEIKTLLVHERLDRSTGEAVFPDRFPVGKSEFCIPSLSDELELLQGLSKSLDGVLGIYPEIKAPAWHRQQGKDISRIVLDLLSEYGYAESSDAIFLQCFDATELQRIRHELRSELPLIQLLPATASSDESSDQAVGHLSADQLRQIAKYAQGIGPPIESIIQRDHAGQLVVLPLVSRAKQAGLWIHPYTFRRDQLPAFSDDPEQVLTLLFQRAEVDGLFSDFPDIVRRHLDRQRIYP